MPTSRPSRTVHVSAHLAAPPERVWEWVGVHGRLAQWTPFRRVVLARPGSPDPNGVGAVRRLEGLGPATEEEILAWDPPSRVVYRVIRGAPLRNHRGEVTLAPEGDGTRLEWTVRFDPSLPGTGWLLERVLQGAFDRAIATLAQRVR